jgi:hypothetical protein
MKYQYACDRCGKTFDNSEECYKHEDEHRYTTLIHDLDVYSTSQLVPVKVFLGIEIDDKPQLFEYQLVGFNSNATEKWSAKLENDKIEEQNTLREMDRKLTAMLIELDANGTEVPDRESYYGTSRIYKETFGKWPE